MLRVTKVALFIGDHWQGGEIDWELIKKAALLHDLGNIVKFKMKEYPDFLGEEKKRLDYWLRVQKEMIRKYGEDDHQATRKMLEDARIGSNILAIIMAKSFHNAVEIDNFDNWPLKILFYSDLRVGPFGIISLKERLGEVIPRLKMYRESDHLDKLVKATYQIEKQIQKNLDVNVSEITERSIERDDKELLKTEV